MAKRKRTPHFWTEEETGHFIDTMKDMNIMAFVDGRKYRDGEIYKKVSEKLRKAGFWISIQDEEAEMTGIAS